MTSRPTRPTCAPTRPAAKATLLAVAAGVLLAGCAHTTRIASKPEGAQVFVNGMPIGTSPAVLQTRSGLPKTYFVRVEKPGYKPLEHMMLESSYRADASLLLLVPGIFPYFFSGRLEDQYVFNLLPEDDAAEMPAPLPPERTAMRNPLDR